MESHPALERNGECQVSVIVVITAGIRQDIPLHMVGKDFPLRVGHIAFHIESPAPAEEDEIEFFRVVRPRAKAQGAGLNVEWEIGHIDITGTFVDDRRNPGCTAIVEHQEHFLVVFDVP